MKKVLIADDQPDHSLLLALPLQDKGFETIEVADGLKAVKVLADEHIDMLITDINMPEMDGIELTQFAGKNHPGLPVVVITGALDSHYRELLLAFGATEIFVKKSSYDEVIDYVTDFFSSAA